MKEKKITNPRLLFIFRPTNTDDLEMGTSDGDLKNCFLSIIMTSSLASRPWHLQKLAASASFLNFKSFTNLDRGYYEKRGNKYIYLTFKKVQTF